MSISAELKYLAEQIAEEKGKDHAWVDQLNDLTEELSGYEDNNMGQVFEGGVMIEEMQKLMTNNLLHFNTNTQAIRDQIVDAWKSRDKSLPDTDVGKKIADEYMLDEYEMWEVINEWEDAQS